MNRVLVDRADVFDRIEILRDGNRHHPSRAAGYAEGYEEALNDLLDAFYGFCSPTFRIKAIEEEAAR